MPACALSVNPRISRWGLRGVLDGVDLGVGLEGVVLEAALVGVGVL